jgi:uncharacterized metal-binding protein
MWYHYRLGWCVGVSVSLNFLDSFLSLFHSCIYLCTVSFLKTLPLSSLILKGVSCGSLLHHSNQFSIIAGLLLADSGA